MTEPQSNRDIIDFLRSSLSEKGPIGEFLLNQVNQVIASGIEEIEHKKNRRGKEYIIHREPTDEEILEIYALVLRSYLLDLPAMAGQVHTELNDKYDYSDIVVDLLSDLTPSGEEINQISVISLKEFMKAFPQEELSENLEGLDLLINELKGNKDYS